MILVNNVNLPLDTNFDDFENEIIKHPTFRKIQIKAARLYKKSIDARRKSDIHFCCSVLIEADNENVALKKLKNAKPYTEPTYTYKTAEKKPNLRPIVVGFGPAGIFAAYTLAKAGLCPIVLERGLDVDSRTGKVKSFWQGGGLDTSTNVQFGEGGAGTFSDGKLTTGIKDIRCKEVLNLLYKFGAKKEILIDAKPHIGTDVLSVVVKNIREEIKKLGGEVRFSALCERIYTDEGKIVSVDIKDSHGTENIPCDKLILATGHSARDTFEMLYKTKIDMVRKPFAVGVRIEHLQEDTNKMMYGDMAGHPALPPAEYKFAVHLPSGRGVYTFCMCPGGVVVNASSEEGKIAVNGMSYSARDGKHSNSALLTEVLPEDLPGEDVLEGVRFQRKIEQKAFRLGGGSGGVPVQTVGDFLFADGTKSNMTPTVLPYAVFANLSEIFPNFVTKALKEGLCELGIRHKGFDNKGALLTAPESRSSSPVRIVRNEKLCSVSCQGLYPCGEGAGYAGGIMSAAVDGMKCAEALIDSI